MRFLIFKINNLPTPVRERVISCLLRNHELCLRILSTAATSPGCPCQSTNKAAVGKVSWSPPHSEVFSSVSNWATCSSAQRSQEGDGWDCWPLSHCVTWHPTARKPPAQMPNQCSQPERDTGVFTGLCNQLVKSEEMKNGERQRKILPGHPLPHLLVKRIITSLFAY